jgi:hypothetical protein
MAANPAPIPAKDIGVIFIKIN